MEENNYRDDFELFLKESVDDFKMVPSRKVWYSLYNNLHPDRKWPSMAVCLLILTAVLYVGVANNNSLSKVAGKVSADNFSFNLNEKNIDSKVTTTAEDNVNLKNKNQQNYLPTVNKKINKKNILTVVYKDVSVTKSTNEQINNDAFNTSDITPYTNTANSLPEILKYKNFVKNTVQKQWGTPENVIFENKSVNNIFNKTIAGIEAENEYLPAKLDDQAAVLQKINLLNIEKSWKEDYAFRNKPAINKFKQNTTLSYYITPSFGYRISKKSGESIGAASSYSLTAPGINYKATDLFDHAALNLEVGAILQYNIAKNVRLKGGMQANYTSYVSSVTGLGHPTQTYLTLNNNNTNIRSSNYAAKAGTDKINKNTLQVSVPLGADFKIAGNGKINWFAGGTVQPTYIIGGNAFVLSSDEKYYISENALLRKINLNSSIETFVSFKSSNGMVLSVGPQFRYQLLSTYKKEYGYNEKLYNVGVKVGVTKSF